MAVKTSTKHRYASIEHRVIDSPAFADLSFSAVTLLLVMARHSSGTNNGHLSAAFKECRKFGIGSEHTLQTAVADLISHGFIFRTKSHGANKVYAKYALTWLPITDKEGLFLNSFQPCAWRNWKPDGMPIEKSTRQKVQELLAESAVSTQNFQQKVQEVGGQNMQTMNCVPVDACLAAPSWIPAYLTRLSAIGLAHACPVVIH